jgi:hypothetical protein
MVTCHAEPVISWIIGQAYHFGGAPSQGDQPTGSVVAENRGTVPKACGRGQNRPGDLYIAGGYLSDPRTW